MQLFHVDAAIVGDGSQILDAAILCDHDRIVEVGAATAVLPRAAGVPIERMRGVALPGLVNAHTHLELSHQRGATMPGRGFVPWLESLNAARAGALDEDRDAAIASAVDELVRFGVVAVGEVTNDGVAAAGALARRGVLGTIFHEFFGVSAGSVVLDAPPPALPSTLRYVRVPHALYSTHPDLVRRLSDGVPTTMHLSEHSAERAFLETGGGPFAAFLDRRGLSAAREAFPIPRLSPIAYADALGLLRPSAAMVHLTDARDAELDLFAARGATAVLCPRSNLFIETRYPPIFGLLSRGIPIAFGTDSLASTPSLDVLAEAAALADKPGVGAGALLAAATSGGAAAVGLGGALGRLRVGSSPGILFIEGPLAGEPARWVLSNLGRPRRLLTRATGTP